MKENLNKRWQRKMSPFPLSVSWKPSEKETKNSDSTICFATNNNGVKMDHKKSSSRHYKQTRILI